MLLNLVDSLKYKYLKFIFKMNIRNQLYYLILNIQLQPTLPLAIVEFSLRPDRRGPAVFLPFFKKYPFSYEINLASYRGKNNIMLSRKFF